MSDDLNQTTTTTPEGATLTEKELWARFVIARIQTTYPMGPTVDSYCPGDHVTDPGEYGHIGDFTAEISDWIANTEEPESELDCLIEDLSNYVDNLRTVRDAFARIKESLAIYPEDESEEDEIRYRAPVTDQKEAV